MLRLTEKIFFIVEKRGYICRKELKQGSMPKKYVTKNKTETVADYNTGEVKSMTVTKVEIIGVEPGFVKMYLKDIEGLYQLSRTDTALLYELLKIMRYEDNAVALNVGIKDSICATINKQTENVMDRNSFNVYLNRLCGRGIIMKVSKGNYQVNAFLFGKGPWKDILNIRMNVEYNKEVNRKLDIVIVKEKEEER